MGARSPCSWCSAKAAYKTQHVAACPVLQQTITLRLLLRSPGGHDPRCCDRLLRTAEAKGGGSRACSPRMLGRESTSDASDGHRAHCRREESHIPGAGAQEVPPQGLEGQRRWERFWGSAWGSIHSTDAPSSSSLQAHSCGAHRLQHGGHDVDDGPNAVEAGGSNGPGTLPEWVCDVFPPVLANEHHTSLGQEERALARAQGSEGCGAIPGSPGLPLSLHVRHHSEVPSKNGEESNAARSSSAAPGLSAGTGGTAPANPLSDVQHRDTPAGDQEGSRPSHSRESVGDLGSHPEALPRLVGHPSLPSYSTALGPHPGPHPPLSPPSGESIPSLIRALRQPDPSHQLGPLATGGRLSSNGKDEPQPPCSRAPEATPAEAARALIQPTASIENRSNHCYANATLQAIHWLCSFLPATQEIWVPAMRSVMQRMSLQARIPDLWTALPWSLAHASWSRPHQQHDAAEYLSFFRRFLIPDLTSGGWQRRILHHRPPNSLCEVTDRGETWPLFVSTPISQLPVDTRLNLTVQKLLHIWQGETALGTLALSEAPVLLALQLNRFHGTLEHPAASLSHADAPAKDVSRIILGMRISLPRFCTPHDPTADADAVSTQLVHYRLHAVLMHQGATAHSGHYRAFLTSGNLPRLQYLCDDGQKATCVSDETPSEVSCHGYILLYHRCNS